MGHPHPNLLGTHEYVPIALHRLPVGDGPEGLGGGALSFIYVKAVLIKMIWRTASGKISNLWTVSQGAAVNFAFIASTIIVCIDKCLARDAAFLLEGIYN